MKSLFTRVLIWLVGCACGTGLLFPASAKAGFAPSAASGWTFLISVKSGTGPLPKSGTALYVMLDTTNVMQIVSLADVEDLLGTFTYAVNSSNSHVAQLKIGNDFNATLGFTNGLAGLYAMSAKVGGRDGTQIGDFVAAHGDALATPANLAIQLTPQSGTIPVTASYSLVFGTNNTYQRYSGGAYSSTKTVNFNRVNHSTLQMYFNDNLMGNGLCRFVFQTENAGFYILKLGAGNNYQLGKFRVDEIAAPVIVSATEDVTATVGSPLRLSVEATGMRPLTYKWQKAGKTIAGATGSSYTINPAKESDAGNFRVFVSNPLGTAVSHVLIARVLCGTTLSSSSATFPYSGGTNSFTVTSTGGCRWTPVAGTNWIQIVSSNSTSVRYRVLTNLTGAPRTGTIVVGNKTFTVLQSPPPARATLTGATVLFNIESGYGDFPSLGKYFFITQPLVEGRTNFQMIPFTPPLPGAFGTNYVYEKDPESAFAARLQYFPTNGALPITFELTYADGTNGTFFGTNADASAFGGNFVVRSTQPDSNRDGRPDLFWHQTNGSSQVWEMSLTNRLTNIVTSVSSSSPSAILAALPTDLDFNGRVDLLQRFANGGVVSFPYIIVTNVVTNSTSPLVTSNVISTNSLANFSQPASSQLVGLNHFTSPYNVDILFQNSDRTLQLWVMDLDATNYTAASVRNGKAADAGWKAVATVDLNGDQAPDILFQHTDGRLAVWYMNGTDYLKSETLRGGTKPPTGWKAGAIMDLNYDGYPDIVFRTSTGGLGTWFMRRSQFLGQQTLTNLPTLGAEWILDGPR